MAFFRSKAPAAPPKALPVPLKQWQLDRASVEELRALLATPAFQKAQATLQALAAPLFSTLNTSDASMVRQLAWQTGYLDAFRDLQKLTKAPDEVEIKDEEAEWGYINTPQSPSYLLDDQA